MTPIALSEKKIVGSDFDPNIMLALASETPAEARKYFIINYFVPVAYTMFANSDLMVGLRNIRYEQAEVCILHICKNLTARSSEIPAPLFPSLTFFSKNDSKIVTDIQKISIQEKLNVLASAAFTEVSKQVFRVKFDDHSLSKALEFAFKDCFDDAIIATKVDNNNLLLSHVPLVASIEKDGAELKVNVLVKTKDMVKPGALTNQAIARNSKDFWALSKKYGKPYNILTGIWQEICPPEDAKDCEVCSLLYEKNYHTNAYLDPELS